MCTIKYGDWHNKCGVCGVTFKITENHYQGKDRHHPLTVVHKRKMFEDGQEIKRSGYLKGTPMKLWRNVFVFGVLMIAGNLGYGIYFWIDRDRLRQKFHEYEEVQREKREREAMLRRRRELLMATRESKDYLPKKN